MQSDRLTRILLIGFVLALSIYLGSFSFIQHRRTFKGPWSIVFSNDSAGIPSLLVEQPKLNISQQITFLDNKLSETNLVRRLVFDDPTKTNVPFGEIIFQDLTFLPGTVTLNLFGHEVELLPRVLIIDKREHPWKSEKVVSVTGSGKF
ncbi:MAG: hypothetical protein ABIR24_05460 [Verrucomicrobiota bacterium]